MSAREKLDDAVDYLIQARAALARMRDDVHGGDEGCGPHCMDYHDAMRAVSRAAECVGLPVRELHREADVLNGNSWKYVGYSPGGGA